MRPVPLALGFLLLAWLCAQQPQALVVGVLSWLQSSTRFSHQQELTESVRITLTHAGQSNREDGVYAGNDAATSPKPVPAMPAPSILLEKVQLAIVGTLNVLPPIEARGATPDATFRPFARPRDVPVPVPRTLA